MDWQGEGTLLAVRPHGEGAAIIEVFTAEHGRHAGLVHGGTGRRLRPVLQPGARLALGWRARLSEHLGTFQVEPLASRASILADPLALAALQSMAALILFALPERDPHPRLHRATEALLDAMAAGEAWVPAYVGWERLLLEETGFGLDLSACAVTGTQEDLVWVSPRSGRAVSRGAGQPWAGRLLPLPAVLRDAGCAASSADIMAALRTTGHFLATRLAPALGREALPAARERLLARLAASTAKATRV